MNSTLLVRKDSYHDSVLLMRISREVKSLEGVADAVVAMATPHNKTLLGESGFQSSDLDGAGPNDLVIAVRFDAESEGGAKGTVARPDDIESVVDRLLSPARPGGGESEGRERRPGGLADALKIAPDANLALISVPGEYAAREARRALARGLHVMLFSDNVSIDDEVALKQEAARKGLLLMGPDCGTATINGKPLAFANRTRRGEIGIVGASGTGIQEIACCIHRLGGGISQAIGTGGRDLSEKVGGIMTRFGIEALAADPKTRVIVVVSKPPAPPVAKAVLATLRESGKPAVVHFVGAARGEEEAGKGSIVFATSLAGAAEEACRLAGLSVPEAYDATGAEDEKRARRIAGRLPRGATLRGLFCGGTTGQEALCLLEAAGIPVYSNLHKYGPRKTGGADRPSGHALLDLGDDEFTAGRPHPMIEPSLRNERLLEELKDPTVGVLLFDVILGYGSHPDPAGVLAEGLAEARASMGPAAPGSGGGGRGSNANARPANAAGPRELIAIASITGTDLDPQDYALQRRTLESAGVVVARDNRSAVRLAAAAIRGIGS